MARTDDLFGSLTYVKPESMYQGLPVNELIEMGKNAHDTYEQVAGGFDTLQTELSNMDINPIDKGIIDNLNSQLGEVIQRGVDSGNFHKMKSELRSNIKNITTDELLKAARSARTTDLEYQKYLEDSKLPQNVKNFLSYQYTSTRQPIRMENGKVVGGSGVRQKVNEWHDIEQELMDDVIKMPVDQLYKLIGDDPNVRIVAGEGAYKAGTVEKLSEDEIRRYAMNRLRNSDKYKEQLQLAYKIAKGGDLSTVSLGSLLTSQYRDLEQTALQKVNEYYNKLTNEQKKAMTAEQIQNLKVQYIENEFKDLFQKFGLQTDGYDIEEILRSNENIDLTKLTPEQRNLLLNYDYNGFLNTYAETVASYGAYTKEDFNINERTDYKYNMQIALAKLNHEFAKERLQMKFQHDYDLEVFKNLPNNPSLETNATENSTLGIISPTKTLTYDSNGNIVREIDVDFVNPNTNYDGLSKIKFTAQDGYRQDGIGGGYIPNIVFSINKVDDYFNSNKASKYDKFLYKNLTKEEKQNIKSSQDLTNVMNTKHQAYLKANKVNENLYKTTHQNFTTSAQQNSATKSLMTRMIDSPQSLEFYEVKNGEVTKVNMPITESQLKDYTTNMNYGSLQATGVIAAHPNLNFVTVATIGGKTYYIKDKNSKNNTVFSSYSSLKNWSINPTQENVISQKIQLKDGNEIIMAIQKVYPQVNGKPDITKPPKLVYSEYDPKTKKYTFLNVPPGTKMSYETIQNGVTYTADGSIIYSNPLDLAQPNPITSFFKYEKDTQAKVASNESLSPYYSENSDDSND